MSIVGNNIRALRTLYGEGRDITQAELAEIAGVTRETVNKWESGSISNVRTSNINRLREHFGLSVDDLRSESAGLASRLKRTRGELDRSRSTHGTREFAKIPLVTIEELTNKSSVYATEQKVEVPLSILSRHPKAVAFIVEDDAMARVLPKGCHAIMDPNVSPSPSALVVAQLGTGRGAQRMVRRLYKGASKIMLSADGFGDNSDYVIEADRVQVIGTIVWYQAADELA